jgi:hypothetical protein
MIVSMLAVMESGSAITRRDRVTDSLFDVGSGKDPRVSKNAWCLIPGLAMIYDLDKAVKVVQHLALLH